MNIPPHSPEQHGLSISQEMNRSLLNQYNNKIHTLLSADNSSESSWNIYDVLAAEISAYIRRENNLPNDVKGILPEETKTQIKTHVLEHISPEAHRLAQASPESTALTFELWFPKYEDYGTGENVRATIKKSLKSRTLSRDHIKNIVRAFFSSRQ